MLKFLPIVARFLIIASSIVKTFLKFMKLPDVIRCNNKLKAFRKWKQKFKRRNNGFNKVMRPKK